MVTGETGIGPVTIEQMVGGTGFRIGFPAGTSVGEQSGFLSSLQAKFAVPLPTLVSHIEEPPSDDTDPGGVPVPV
ncbi:hypothetical protein [Nocardioides convexus]|uniref:hypothetical protein n=1 Tax=Nocardioides convexus TaxID=2712224 RepID=UPI00241815C3|nr:hypothetical protein [Nocardioides convexus]